MGYGGKASRSIFLVVYLHYNVFCENIRQKGGQVMHPTAWKSDRRGGSNRIQSVGRHTSPLNFLVTQAKPARGTLVAMVGMRASCHPMPVLISVAPRESRPDDTFHHTISYHDTYTTYTPYTVRHKHTLHHMHHTPHHVKTK